MIIVSISSSYDTVGPLKCWMVASSPVSARQKGYRKLSFLYQNLVEFTMRWNRFPKSSPYEIWLVCIIGVNQRSHNRGFLHQDYNGRTRIEEGHLEEYHSRTAKHLHCTNLQEIVVRSDLHHHFNLLCLQLLCLECLWQSHQWSI